MTIKNYFILCLLIFSLSGCLSGGKGKGGDDSDLLSTDSDFITFYQAAITTVDPSYSGGAVQIASVDYDAAKVSIGDEVISQDQSDFKVSAFKKHFYHIGRFQIDTLYKYAFDKPSEQLLQGNLGEGFDLSVDESSINVGKLVFVSSQKAYMINQSSDRIWVVNPSAKNENNFKLGELDLSAYADGDSSAYGDQSYPEMVDARIVDGKLFVLMQRLKDWCPDEPDAFIAVFNTLSDTEIDIDSANDPEALKGIRLTVRNPSSMDYESSTGLVVAAVGGGTVFCSLDDPYSGGIESIDPDSYETNLILDDGDAAKHPYDFIASAVVVDSSNGYFSSYAGWGDTRLYHFNPGSGEVTGIVPGFGDAGKIDIRVLAKAPDGTTWVGTAQDLSDSEASPYLFMLDEKQEVMAELELLRDPESIAFSAGR